MSVLNTLDVIANNWRSSQFARNPLGAKVLSSIARSGITARDLASDYLPGRTRFVEAPRPSGTRFGAVLPFDKQIEWASIACEIIESVHDKLNPLESTGLSTFLRIVKRRGGRYVFDRYGGWRSRVRRTVRIWQDQGFTQSCTVDVKDCYGSVTGELAASSLHRIGVPFGICLRTEDFIDEFGRGLPIGELTSDIIIKAILLPAYEELLWDVARGSVYLDDFFVMDHSRFGAGMSLARLSQAIDKIGLQINPEKSAVHGRVETRFLAYGIDLKGLDITRYVRDEAGFEYDPGLAGNVVSGDMFGFSKRRYMQSLPQPVIAGLVIDVDDLAYDEYRSNGPGRSQHLVTHVLSQLSDEMREEFLPEVAAILRARPWQVYTTLSSTLPYEVQDEIGGVVVAEHFASPWLASASLDRAYDWVWEDRYAHELASFLLRHCESTGELRAIAYKHIADSSRERGAAASILNWGREHVPGLQAACIMSMAGTRDAEDYFRLIEHETLLCRCAVNLARRIAA